MSHQNAPGADLWSAAVRSLARTLSLGPGPNGRGYTLIEVLVALAVLGFITAMLVVAFQQARTVMVGVVDVRQRRGDVLDLQKSLRNWLAAAHPFASDRTQNQTIYALHGTSTGVTLSTPLDLTNGQNDLYRVRIGLNALDKTLIGDIEPDRYGLDEPGSAASLELLSGVEDVTLSYLDSSVPGIWQTEWQGRGDLPRAIKISVGFPAEDLRLWPDLIINLHVTGREYCAFDPVVRRCR